MHKLKNKLKDLIYIQENKPCNEQTVKGLFRSIVEPILESNVECVVLCRFEEESKKDFNGIIQRLEYSNAKVYDFSDKSLGKFENVLKENIWDKTEFIYVLSERYGAVLIFDYEECDIDNFAQIYILHNSRSLSDAFGVISSNSIVDLKSYEERWHPDRRENEVLNSSIRKIVENLNEKNQEILISELAKETTEDHSDIEAKLEFISNKSSHVSHEMRNQLSICNLYTSIIQKQHGKIKFESDEVKCSILNALECIQKSLQIAGNILLDLKSLNNLSLKEYDLKYLIENAIGLAQIYATGKNISFECEIPKTANILVDENKFLAVLINIIKNAVESIGDNNKGRISIKTEVENENVKITIANNGKPMTKEIQNKIFSEGFTTKSAGKGLGLFICRKTLEEQSAQLKLKKSDEISTEFEISLLRGGV